MHRRFALLLLGSAVFAKGRKTIHPKGFSFELPDKWRFEPAPQGGVLLPPGVTVDPEKEDNPEVYSFRVPELQGAAGENNFIEDLKADLHGSKIEPERGGDMENFSSPGIGGVIYTFDFAHPRQKVPYRIRVYAMTSRGKVVLLVASGHRARLLTRDRVLRELARSVSAK